MSSTVSLTAANLRRGEATMAASMIGAFMECSPTIQAVVLDMIAIINSDDSDPDDVDAALNTLIEALFHEKTAQICEQDEALFNSPQLKAAAEEIESEHAHFATRVRQLMEEKGFASTNIMFGVGSYTYQYVTRDTFGFAMKATSAVINGERRAIFKDPITATPGNQKKSARGLLRVDLDSETCRYVLHEDATEIEEIGGYLDTVFEDGQVTQETDLAEIRHRLTLELESILD